MENYFDFGAKEGNDDSFFYRNIDVGESIDQFEVMRVRNTVH